MDPRSGRRRPQGRVPPGPPKTRAVELYNGYLPRPGETIAHEPSTISAQDMWSKYISKRRPVVIDGFLHDQEWQGEKWTDVEYLRSKAGFAEVKIEPVHPTAGHFGTAQKRQKVRFGAFLDMLQDPQQAGQWYLTTQYEDEDDEQRERASSLNPTAARLRPLGETTPEAEGNSDGAALKRKRDRSSSEGSRGAEETNSAGSEASASSPPTSLDDEEELELDPVLPSPTHALADDFPLQAPAIMGNLVLQQCNFWLGNSPQARSSGLHHDMHDNLYVLLAGRKRFLLFPPVAHKWLRPRGEVEWIHPNGLIVYGEEGIIPAWHPAGTGLPIVRGDGLLPVDAARWRLRARERSLKEADDKAAELAGEGSVVANRRKGKAKQTIEQALALERFQEAELALRLLLAQRDEEDDDGRSTASEGSFTMEGMLALMGAKASRGLSDVVSSDEDLDEDDDEDEEEDPDVQFDDDGSNWPFSPAEELELLQDANTGWVRLLGPRQPPAFLILRWRAGDAVATEILLRWSQQRDELLKALAALQSSDAEGAVEEEDEDESDEAVSDNSDMLKLEAEGEQMTEAQIRQAIREGKLAVADVGPSEDDDDDRDLVELSDGADEAELDDGWHEEDEEMTTGAKLGDSDDDSSDEIRPEDLHRPTRSPPLYIPPGMLPGGLRGRLDGLPDSDDDEYLDEADEFEAAMLGEMPGEEGEEGEFEIDVERLQPEMRERIEAMLAAQAGEDEDDEDGSCDEGSEEEEEGGFPPLAGEDDDDEDSEEATEGEGPGTFGAGSDGSDWGEGDVDDGEAALAALAAQAGDDADAGTGRQGSDGSSSREELHAEEEEEDEPQSFSIVSPQDVHRYFGIPDQLGGAAATSGNGDDKSKTRKKRANGKGAAGDDDDEEPPQIHPGCPRPLVVDLRPGQMLYLPTSWFHEVTSAAAAPEEVSSAAGEKKPDLRDFAHAALNYWFWPPTALEPRPDGVDAEEAAKEKRGKGKKSRKAALKGEGRAPPPSSSQSGSGGGSASGNDAQQQHGQRIRGTHLSPYEDDQVWDEVRRSVDELVRDAKRLGERQRRVALAGANGKEGEEAGSNGSGGGNKRRRGN